MLVSKVGAGTYLRQLPANWSQNQIVEPLSNLIDEITYRFDVQEARMILEGGTAWYAAQRAAPQETLKKIRYCYDQISRFQVLGDDD